MRPGQHRFTRELRAVVRTDDDRLAALRTDPIQDACQVIAADRVLRHDGHGFVRRVVDDHQALQRPSRGNPIEHEVHRPNLVRSTRTDQRLAIGDGDLLAPPPADVQLPQPIQPPDAFVVHELTGLAQLQVDHADSIAPVPLRQRHDPRSQCAVAIWARLVTHRTRAHAYDLQAVTLREALRLHPPHQLTTHWGGHHFFRSASRVTSFSSIDSANSFFSRAFSASSAFTRFASDTRMPPTLLRHR